MCFEASHSVEALPSSAFLHLFQASGVDSTVFACASASECTRRDFQALAMEIFQRVFHLLCRLRVREGDKREVESAREPDHTSLCKAAFVDCLVPVNWFGVGVKAERGVEQKGEEVSWDMNGIFLIRARNRARLHLEPNTCASNMRCMEVTGKMRKISVRQGMLSSPPVECTTFTNVCTRNKL